MPTLSPLTRALAVEGSKCIYFRDINQNQYDGDTHRLNSARGGLRDARSPYEYSSA